MVRPNHNKNPAESTSRLRQSDAMTAIGAPIGVSTGIRPFNPLRDLPGVMALLADVFGPELSLESRQTARVVRRMQRHPAIGWLWMGFDAWFDGSIGGYVWVDGRRVVGNANIAPIGPTGRQWVLSNVAVAEDLRGRGIGRRLVEACLDRAWSCGAERVLLQVWEGNGPALHLYRSLGFSAVGRVWRLSADAACASWAEATVSATDWRWRRLRGRDLQAIHELLNRMLPTTTARLVRPTLVHPFRPGLTDYLSALGIGWARRPMAVRRVLGEGRSVAAALALIPVDDGLARLTVAAAPDPGESLVSSILAELGSLLAPRPMAVLADVAASLRPLRDRMVARGWVHQDSLLQMVAERPYGVGPEEGL